LSYDSSIEKYKIPNFEDVEECKARKDEYERLNPYFTLNCLGPTWSKSESDADFIPKVNQQILKKIKNDGKYGFGSTVSGTANLFGIWDSPFKLELENDHSLRYFTLATAKSGDIQWDCRLNSECSKVMPELAFHGLKAMFSSAASKLYPPEYFLHIKVTNDFESVYEKDWETLSDGDKDKIRNLYQSNNCILTRVIHGLSR